MLVAFAALLIHPQLAPTISLSAEKAALSASATVSPSSDALPAESSLPAETLLAEAVALPAAELDALLPDAPVPPPALSAPAPMAFITPSKRMTVTLSELRAENQRNQRLWTGLTIAASGAATFDAWTTRRAITVSKAQELNPLLKPFAGNASLYAVIQVGPLLMDFAGRKMMYSRHPWVRHMWWVPQSASFVGSLFCGAHNLTVH